MSSGTSTPGSVPKSMSSRLLTMKFMQRAAASSPTTPSPSTPDEPSPKRRKKDTSSHSSSSFDVNALADQRAIKAAFAEEEAKRQAALDRAATESGDTRWVLSFEDQQAGSASPILALRVVQTGYANLDAPSSSRAMEEDMEEDKPVIIGRRSFGKFNKALEKKQDGKEDSDLDSEEGEDEESEEESDDDDDPASELIRVSRHESTVRAKEERKAQKLAAKAESEKLAKKRKKTEVKLNGLTSLSGRQNTFKGACFTCGGPHHKKDCPQTHKRGYQGGGDDGPPRKAIKSR